jgi:hypothetical protein
MKKTDPIAADAVYVSPKIRQEDGKFCVQLAIMVDRGTGECIESLLFRCDTEKEAAAFRDQFQEKIAKYGKCVIFTLKGFPEYKPKRSRA